MSRGTAFTRSPTRMLSLFEFDVSRVLFLQQPRYDVVYKSVKVGEYISDLIAFGAIVVDYQGHRRDWPP
jgi:hypothetical protein